MKNKYRIIEICSLLFCVIISPTLSVGLNNYIAVANVDAWMSPIIGSILGIIPFSIYIYIINYKPDLNIHEKNIALFGKILGKILNILLILAAITLLLVNIYSLVGFISSEYLYNTPKLFISFMFLILIMYFFSKKFQILCKANIIFIFIAFLLFTFSFLGLIMQVRIDNILPILEFGIKNPIIGGLLHIGYIILPTFIITMIPKEHIKNNKKYTKYLYITYGLANACIFIVCFLVMSIFGIELSTLYKFPVFHILKRALVSTVFERLESILSIQWIIYLLITSMVLIYYSLSGIEHTFNMKNFKYKKFIYYSFIAIMVFLGTNLFKNNTLANSISLKVSPFLLYGFYLLIPLIIFLRIRHQKKSH